MIQNLFQKRKNCANNNTILYKLEEMRNEDIWFAGTAFDSIFLFCYWYHRSVSLHLLIWSIHACKNPLKTILGEIFKLLCCRRLIITTNTNHIHCNPCYVRGDSFIHSVSFCLSSVSSLFAAVLYFVLSPPIASRWIGWFDFFHFLSSKYSSRFFDNTARAAGTPPQRTLQWDEPTNN